MLTHTQVVGTFQTRTIHGRKLDFQCFQSVGEAVSLARNIPKGKLAPWERGDWNGLGADCTIPQWLAAGKSEAALAAFNAAQTRIDTHNFAIGGGLRPSPAGGAWIVPLVLQGLPMASRVKARAKLPPLNLTLNVEILAYGGSAILANCAAAIARALRQYQLEGGVASLKVCHWTDYSESNPRGTVGCATETFVNLSDENALSVALSPVLARATLYPLMDYLSKERGTDTLPRYRKIRNIGDYFQGTRADYALVRKLGIETPKDWS